MTAIDNDYDPDSIEPQWREQWQEMELYQYEDDDERPDYIIDTPPPYPTGNFHIGNSLGWCYMDFAARYHRLQGDDVLFPQGWDCHGLPTEVKVEEKHDIHRTDVSRDRFRELCIEHTESQIDAMYGTMLNLGFSQDWSQEFRTMDPEYWGETQRSFVRMADEDLVYRDEHPVNWCPRCETAIADAEVENEDRTGTLYYLTFEGIDNDDIEIATTRPELLPACVGMAVSPDDDRFEDRIGDSFRVPLFEQEVTLFSDDEVDGDFGTGAVMVCTFGDKQDVNWWTEHNLNLRPALTETGHLNERAGEYEGLSIQDGKDEIASALAEAGVLNDQEPTEQSVGICWRCDTPIEILSKEQWFVRVDQEEILQNAQEIEWLPEHMYTRLEEWTEGMDWDWVISRQREFATPIPAWFCANCDHTHIATEADLPIDPTDATPEIDCPDCGGSDWVGDTDVMDTWMDSSISALYINGWPDESFEPVQLREQGHDIIRTWAFYTILRTGALEDELPWEQALINGMVFGEDGNKMSKSRDNFVQPSEVVSEHSADAFRQAIALGGQPGSDIQFQSKEVTSASRFLTKLWNITRFASNHLDEDTPAIQDPAYRDADKWIIGRCREVATSVSKEMDDYRFDGALRELREFIWHDLADDYLELLKGRLYEGRPGERDAARHALYTVLKASLTMLAPFAPFITEEAYQSLPDGKESVHLESWPSLPTVDPATINRGQLIADTASAIRGWKSDTGMALNEELDRIEVYVDEADDEPAIDTYDLSSAVNAPVYIEVGRPNVELVPVAVDPDHSVIGPEFRENASAVVDALEAADPAEIKAEAETNGELTLDLGTQTVALDVSAIEINEELRAASGEEVDVLDLDNRDATVLIYR
ncbi:valine--tRNA ligase [Halocatena halophila]|uniref:valine--tRNA ligase n=1 Tax=Halocatena halophila TaxID=2814576 RepID=UPI002ED02783